MREAGDAGSCHHRVSQDPFAVVQVSLEPVAGTRQSLDADGVDAQSLPCDEPVGVVQVDGERNGSTSDAVIPFSARKAWKVFSPATSRCQSGPERSDMPAGMCSRQNPIGAPTVTVSMPWR